MKRLVLLCFVLAGCSGPGGGNGGPPNPPPPPRPSVSITTPAPGAQVSGMTTIAASVQNPPAGAMLQFKLDNPSTNIGLPVPVTNGSTSTGWNSASASDGPHTLSASLTDGSATSSPVSVMVANTGVSSVSITSPPPGAMLSGTVNLNAACSSDLAGSSVQFKYDGNNIGGPASVVSGTASQQWNTVGILNGSHILSAQLVGSTVTSQPVAVTLANPQVTFITPPTGSIVSGNVTLSASCSNCPQNSSIQFQDGPNNIGGPAQVAGGVATRIWDTSQVGNGSHTLTAQLVGSLSGGEKNEVTVRNPITQAPRIDSISRKWFGMVCPFVLCQTRSFTVTGANFVAPPEGSIHFSGMTPFTWSVISATQIRLDYFIAGSNNNPGDSLLGFENSFGISNFGHVVYVSPGNNLRATTTRFYVLDPGARRIAVYDRATQDQIEEIGATGFTLFDVDNLSTTIVASSGTGGMAVLQSGLPSGSGGVGYDAPIEPVMGSAILDGIVCAAKPQNGRVGVINILTHNFNTSTGGDQFQDFDSNYDVGGQPFPVVRWKSGNDQYCGSVDVAGNRLLILNLTAQTWFDVPINGLRSASELAFDEVGFKLATNQGASVVAYLHVADEKLLVFNRQTGNLIRTKDLSHLDWVPTQHSVGEDGTIAVWRFDTTPGVGLGHVAKISSSGTLTDLSGQLQRISFAADGVYVEGGVVYVTNHGVYPNVIPLN